MADTARAEELVHAVERDAAFRAQLEAAGTIAARKQVVDAHGYEDVTLDEMKAYVESKGGTLTVRDGGRELSEQELAAVAGGMTDAEIGITAGAVGGIALGIGIGLAASI